MTSLPAGEVVIVVHTEEEGAAGLVGVQDSPRFVDVHTPPMDAPPCLDTAYKTLPSVDEVIAHQFSVLGALDPGENVEPAFVETKIPRPDADTA